jgi:hypothetical protein
MPAVCAVVLAALALYGTFMAIDGLGLSDRPGTAIVRGKQHRQAHATYANQRVGNTTISRSQTVPAMDLLDLEIEGQPATAAVEKSIFDAVRTNDRVEVTYQQRRLTGALQVTSVRR